MMSSYSFCLDLVVGSSETFGSFVKVGTRGSGSFPITIFIRSRLSSMIIISNFHLAKEPEARRGNIVVESLESCIVQSVRDLLASLLDKMAWSCTTLCYHVA